MGVKKIYGTISLSEGIDRRSRNCAVVCDEVDDDSLCVAQLCGGNNQRELFIDPMGIDGR